MERLCERPGCSDPASVAYGMRAADLVFWLDSLTEGGDQSHGVLCRRHADSMVVPRNWTLDDIRDPDLHLFRPPPPAQHDARSRRKVSRRTAADQLDLGIDVEATIDVEAPIDAAASESAVGSSGIDGNEEPDAASPAIEPAAAEGVIGDEDTPDPWTPTFDNDDDLDGLLAARSPLLARAFRGADRPRTS